jgi:hypothetical protein
MTAIETAVSALGELGIEFERVPASWDALSCELCDAIVEAAAVPEAVTSADRDAARVDAMRCVPMSLLPVISSAVGKASSQDDVSESIRSAVHCWAAAVTLCATLVGLPDDFAQGAGDVGALLAAPFVLLSMRVVERATFHFPPWQFGERGAASSGESSVPEHFLDFCSTELHELRAQLTALSASLATSTARGLIAAAMSGAESSVRQLFLTRYLRPAIEAVGSDTGPLLHCATVLGAAALAHRDRAEDCIDAPCTSCLTSDGDVFAAWLAAERQYLGVTFLGEAALHGRPAGNAASWRRSRLQLDVAAAQSPLSGASQRASSGLPFSACLPDPLRVLPHGLVAQAQRAAPLLSAGAGGDPQAAARSWALFLDRVVLWVVKWWRDTLAKCSAEARDAEELVARVLAPCHHVGTKLSETLVPLLRGSMEWLGGLTADRLLSPLEEEIDQLLLLRDAAARQCVDDLLRLEPHAADALLAGFACPQEAVATMRESLRQRRARAAAAFGAAHDTDDECTR